MKKTVLLAALITSAALVFPGRAAYAHGGGVTLPSETPPSPAGDGASAQQILKDLTAKAEKDAETAKVVAEPLKQAKKALERAFGARGAGDEPHARMLDALALTWAEAARDLDRAAAAERVANTTSQRAREAQTRAERARALLEETQARRERATAELQRVEVEAKDAARGAADAEAQRLDRAKKKGAAPAPAKAAAKKAGKGGK